MPRTLSHWIFSAAFIVTMLAIVPAPLPAQEAAVAPVSAADTHELTAAESAIEWRLPFDVRAGGMCLFLFIMIVTGVLAIFMKQALPGILFLAGGLLLAVDPLLDLLLFRLLVNSDNSEALNWGYSIGSLASSLGAYVLIAVAFLIVVKRAKAATRT